MVGCSKGEKTFELLGEVRILILSGSCLGAYSFVSLSSDKDQARWSKEMKEICERRATGGNGCCRVRSNEWEGTLYLICHLIVVYLVEALDGLLQNIHVGRTGRTTIDFSGCHARGAPRGQVYTRTGF